MPFNSVSQERLEESRLNRFKIALIYAISDELSRRSNKSNVSSQMVRLKDKKDLVQLEDIRLLNGRIHVLIDKKDEPENWVIPEEIVCINHVDGSKIIYKD